jgi:hypothetical protein
MTCHGLGISTCKTKQTNNLPSKIDNIHQWFSLSILSCCSIVHKYIGPNLGIFKMWKYEIWSTFSNCRQLWWFLKSGDFFQKHGICDRILYFESIFSKMAKTHYLVFTHTQSTNSTIFMNQVWGLSIWSWNMDKFYMSWNHLLTNEMVASFNMIASNMKDKIFNNLHITLIVNKL